MDRIDALCDKDKAMLTEFSGRTLKHLTGRPLDSLQLPYVNEYVHANVMKECEKDRIVIERAAAAFAADAGVEDLDVEDLFEKTKSVDRAFVRGLAIPSLTITLNYENIADIRKKRIALLAQAALTLLRNGNNGERSPLRPGPEACTTLDSFEASVRRAYAEKEFKTLMTEFLRLFIQETRVLSGSVSFLHPFNRAINFFAEPVFDAMEQAAEELTNDCAAKIYRPSDHG